MKQYVKKDIIEPLHFAFEKYLKEGDESNFKQRLGGIKGAHPRTWKDLFLNE
jgi:hypothetical protein